ncbi:MAG TPA: polysaccharide biosynthesis/export family protein [Candidatus Acidoferrum sp.]|jgi:polysaccharide export outer membrane protein|nr:polysaccharide biosynthesis/export family protein [Candidatus Acidoferrum sp.]
MSKLLSAISRGTGRELNLSLAGKIAKAAAGVGSAVCFLWALSGCQTQQSAFAEVSPPDAPKLAEAKSAEAPKPDVIVLHEGDTVRISFPGAPTLNTIQQIRRDGRVTLPLIGEFKAAGLTPPDMEKELIKQYGPQLVTKEVTVSVDSSAFPIYVTGAVLRPGKILSDRPLTALQAIMEAGGFDYTKANLKKIRVIRTENGQTEHHVINLKGVLQGEQADQFKLKPADIIYVPERFSWF